MNISCRLIMPFQLAALIFAVTGCISVMSEERLGTPVETTVVQDEHPVGVPRMTVAVHDDGLGWAIAVETRVERTLEYRAAQQWRGRRYVFSPLSIFPGLIQCPIGLLHLFNDNPENNIFRFGCSRLALFEPLDGVTPMPPTSVSVLEKKTAWEALQHGIIQLEWGGHRHKAVTYVISGGGETDVRLSDLLSQLVLANVPLHGFHMHPLRIRLRYGDGSMVEQMVTVNPNQFDRARRSVVGPIASEQWPSDTVVQIRIQPDGLSLDERELVRDELIGSLIQHRICVVTEGLHSHVLDEQRVQYSGVVDERTQVRLGELLSPSIILTASVGRSGEEPQLAHHMVVQVRDVREGQILGTAHGRSRLDTIVGLVQRTVTELDLLMAKAPKKGCPR
jgi:hypothetical protein